MQHIYVNFFLFDSTKGVQYRRRKCIQECWKQRVVMRKVMILGVVFYRKTLGMVGQKCTDVCCCSKQEKKCLHHSRACLLSFFCFTNKGQFQKLQDK